MFSAFLIFLIIACCQAQIPQPGPCMEMETPTDYNPTKILGRWYKYAVYPSCSPIGKCGQTLFIDDHDRSTTMIEKQLLSSADAFPIWEKVSKVKYIDDGSYLITNPTDDPLFNRTLTIWSTDYVSYAIKGSCVNFDQLSLIYAWILTRMPHPFPSVLAKIDEVIKAEGLQKEFFRIQNQTDCPPDF